MPCWSSWKSHIHSSVMKNQGHWMFLKQQEEFAILKILSPSHQTVPFKHCMTMTGLTALALLFWSRQHTLCYNKCLTSRYKLIDVSTVMWKVGHRWIEVPNNWVLPHSLKLPSHACKSCSSLLFLQAFLHKCF